MAKVSERDRYEYGICINRDMDGKPCPKYVCKEVQKIRKSQDLICDVCKEPLRKVPPPSSSPAWGIIIGIAVAAIIVVGLGAYMLFFKDSNNENGKLPQPDAVYTVSFNSDGGSEVASQTVKNGEKATKPANPTKRDHDFDEWFSDSEFTNQWNFETEVTRNITLYAKWNQKLEDDKPLTGKGTKIYSFGKYDGDLVNGRPHGQGTMSYTCKVQIAKMARTTYYAVRGDILQGVWYNGDIEHGDLRGSDNQQKANIRNGRRPSLYNLADDKCEP